MPLNSLISQAGLKLGPLVLETLVKHYLERALKDRSDGTTQLSQDELLYDEAFHIVKTFLEASTKHTVEELQEFSNTRTPSPPWTHVVRLVVPMSCCDDAATYLIQALGGEEVTKRVVGGTKWWQVRGVRGIDAEWLTAKKDWEQAKRRNKAQMKEKATDSPRSGKVQDGTSEDQYAPAAYEPEMDKMRCILFAHGGGYYFGSIDQERYSLERYARKIKGRIFAINYRLAPQYPFPCALQDFLAAYLFLIRPPEGASHQPVDPAHIVVAGDSAGGGMTIALLQIIRDTGLPMPAGGVLISPWCDLTHSFPSIHINTATDVLPPYGLSFHKPSTLWPPPPKELAAEVQRGIRSRVREALHMGRGAGTPMEADRAVQEASQDGVEHQFHIGSSGQTLHLGSTATLPTPTSMGDQTVTLRTSSGEVLRIEEQVQMYTPNNLLTHPLVSSVLSYLGGLPPLLVIASDKEVLRDEIIYFAHKAAHPDQHRVKDEAREMYPALRGIEERFGPTKVHLQVYDDAAHVLPTLFSFTTPAKYCYRAIASFCKYVTGMLPPPAAAMSGDLAIIASPVEMESTSNLSGLLSPSGSGNDGARSSSLMPPSHSTSSKAGRSRFARPQTSAGRASDAESSKSSNRRVRRTVSISVTRASSFFQRGNSGTSPPPSSAGEVSESGDVAGPRFGDLPSPRKDGQRTAGEASVYDGGLDVMIRERVATNGVIRPLEPESELPAMQFPEELVGTLSELVVRRYYKGRDKFSRKFTKAAKSIEKKRRHNLARAQTDTMRNMSQLQTYLSQDEHAVSDPHPRVHGIQEGMISAATWPWAWALDLDEEPPPSSIVARRDTEEARRLARIADQAFLADENAISGNNLWSVVVDFLTKAPHKHNHGDGEKDTQIDDDDTHQEKPRSMLSKFMGDRRKGGAAAKHADRA
ncbi:alpha/beta-hydrolase [Wolfiporia cocos MD-104 SS10]|uniref:Alpha/beta-hydrolase n=1 Tax=Wolfiporia cocos (strain MD-104) TaxID=742152 RepID=A0A2H3J741_WOLCO|nr:alpha/beta-hydrolase [Wolfiporia cocos MD-104 SS10]